MSRSLLCYHPRIGHLYVPCLKSRVPFETGGYLVRTNSAGFRSEREFERDRSPGKFRAILFGDSMTAGDGVSNSERFSDQLEQAVPGLEIFNFGLSGTGTDQQYLTYLNCANVEHDLVILCINVANISRVHSRFRTFHDDRGKEVIYAKPYFEIEKGELSLCNVPVPKGSWTRQTLPADDLPHLDTGVDLWMFPETRASLRRIPLTRHLLRFAVKLGIRDMLQKITRFKRIPGYDAPDSQEWILVRKIVVTWVHTSQRPVLLVPIPMWPHINETSDPDNYQFRFRELASDTGCVLHDPLPDLIAHTPDVRRNFRFKHDGHFSSEGHQAIAQSLAPTIENLIRNSVQH